MYLDSTDARYNEHHVYVVDTTSAEYMRGYKGKVAANGDPVDQVAYDKWLVSLPHIWQNNPFNNHFLFVDENITDRDLQDKAHEVLNEFLTGWTSGLSPIAVWKSKTRPKLTARTLTPEQQISLGTKLNELKVSN